MTAAREYVTVLSGFVYFIGCEDDQLVKIGFSTNMPQRWRTLAGGDRKKLHLIGFMPGTVETERWMHRRFDKVRTNGEWFQSTAMLRRFIATAGLMQLADIEGLAPKKPALTVLQSPQLSEDDDAPTVPLDPSVYLDPDEVTRLFKVISSPRDRAIFRLMYHRGLRASEPGLMQFSDWNRKEGLLHIRRIKGSVSQSFRILPVERVPLFAWLKIRGTRAGAMFPSRQQRRAGFGIHRNQLDRLFRAYCRKAGIPDEKAHLSVLKHTCGAHLSASGKSVQSIQEWLGLRSIQHAAIYTSVSDAQRERMLDSLWNWK